MLNGGSKGKKYVKMIENMVAKKCERSDKIKNMNIENKNTELDNTDKSVLIEQLEWALVKTKHNPKPNFNEISEHLDYAQSLVKKLTNM